MQYLNVGSIVVVCYVFAEIFKVLIPNKTKLYKIIPSLVGILGGIIGSIMYIVDKTLILEVDNVFSAIAVGMVSGLASTGSHQVIKQLLKKE